ncbi:hypothetical protein D3C76_974530 [compost metagenome]
MNPNIHVWANLSLNAHIYIREIRGNKVKSKCRPIFLMELGHNTICFLSDLDLPMLPNIVYGFDIVNGSSKVKLSGKIESKGIYEHSYQYRVNLNNAKGHQLYNTRILQKMLINLDYFFSSNHKKGLHTHRNIIGFI